ncbi:MAG: hypothetical protein VX589_09370 [Myxococcota bacterium]|nr:hypothetical protein [Myxococcota bacterium]
MSEQHFRFDVRRTFRSLIGLVPIAGFPLILGVLGHHDPGISMFFLCVGLTLIAGVIYTAVRFKLTIDSDGITCRGRIHRRRIEFAELEGATLRRGRDKPTRFMGPPPFQELALRTDQKRLVISSLPLGSEAFTAVVEAVSKRIEIEVDATSAEIMNDLDSSIEQS